MFGGSKMFKGLIIKESLNDLKILDKLKITKQEDWDVDNAVDYQSNKWTAIFIEGEDKGVKETVKEISKAIKEKWYANVSLGEIEYVIFNNMVFEYKKGDEETKQKAMKYGREMGIPESQLDWK